MALMSKEEIAIRLAIQAEVLNDRRKLLASLPRVMKQFEVSRRLKVRGQRSLFEGMDEAEISGNEPNDPIDPAWTDAYLIAREREVLGCYLSLDPFLGWMDQIVAFSTHTMEQFRAGLPDESKVTLGGMVRGLTLKTTKSGRGSAGKMARFSLDGPDGSVNAIAWPDTVRRLRKLLVNGFCGFLSGRVSRSRQEPDLIVREAVPMTEARGRLSIGYLVRTLGKSTFDVIRLDQLATEYPGKLDLFVCHQDRRVRRIGPGFKVRHDPGLVDALVGLYGRDGVALVGIHGVLSLGDWRPPG
jgi:DNA polymerase III alpha subunit